MRVLFALWTMVVVLGACGVVTVGAVVSDVPAWSAVFVDVILLPFGIFMAWAVLDE